MNISLGGLEDFVREKLAQGDYESASEVVQDGLRLLKEREDGWRATMVLKIEEGLQSCQEGKLIPATQAWAMLQTWRSEQVSRRDE